MIKRTIEKKILNSLKNFPAVAILGPRQVGKTTLAKEIKKKTAKKTIYLDLDLTSNLNKLSEPELFLNQFDFSTHLIIIDEIQRKPELFPILKAIIDKDRNNGSFLILGSASRDLIRQSSETLAGRIIFHELSPFTIQEIPNPKLEIIKLWERGGFPESFLADNRDGSFEWREAFIRTFLERDIPQLGIRVPTPQLKKFWTMIAHNHGQLFNANQLSRSLGVTAPTVRHYLSILEETFIVRQLKSYYSNVKKRLVKSPKIYIRDSGLFHNILMLNTFDQLQGHPAIGYSWEGFIIEQVLGYLPLGWESFFYRTSAGAEIDLILQKPGKELISIEIKYSATPKAEKGFKIAYNDLECKRGYIIYPGSEAYPLGENIRALPAEMISEIFSPTSSPPNSKQ